MIGTTNAVEIKKKYNVYNYSHLRFWGDGTDLSDHSSNNLGMSYQGTTSNINVPQQILHFGTHPCFYNSGTGGYIKIDNFNYPMSNTTITAWARLINNTTWTRVCDFGHSSGGTSTVSLGSGGGVWRYGSRQGGSSNSTDFYSPVNTGIYNFWYFIAYSIDVNIFKGYINGQEVASKTTSWTFPATNTTTLNGIFQSNYNTSERGIGYVTDLRVYDYTLDEDEIEQLWKIGPQHHTD